MEGLALLNDGLSLSMVAVAALVWWRVLPLYRKLEPRWMRGRLLGRSGVTSLYGELRGGRHLLCTKPSSTIKISTKSHLDQIFENN